MDLKYYSSFFHDGGIINIKQFKNNIEIMMESNQLCPEWNRDKVQLTNFQTIRGILHAHDVKKILIDHKNTKKITMIYDSGEILDFDIYKVKSICIVW